MDLRQLRYFVELAAQQNYGRAASALHVAQPALSRQIRLLEEELGVQLFERHARGATPTEEAVLLLQRATYLLRYAEEVKQEIGALQRHARGTVAVGLTPGLALFLTIPLLRAVMSELPGVRLRIVEGFPSELRSLLLQGGVDVAILNAPVELSSLVTRPLVTERICLIGLPGATRAAGSRVSMRSLAHQPLIMTGMPKSGVRLEVEIAAARAGVILHQVVEVATLEVAKRLVYEGLGSTIHFAAPIREEIAAGQLTAVPVQRLQVHRILARAADRPASRAAEAVTEALRTVIERLVLSGRWPHATLGRSDATTGGWKPRITAEGRKGAQQR
jgi:LysR family nitrogen assimilation transcriptional regulator